MKFSSLLILLVFTCYSCNQEETGACTISCGGSGTGQPFSWKNHPFKTESECKQMGADQDKSSGNACKASYCPPTGNSNDCYQVYP